VLAFIVAAEVAVQPMVVVRGTAGLSKWVDGGGVFDKAVIEEAIGSGGMPFPRWSASSCTASTRRLWTPHEFGSQRAGAAICPRRSWPSCPRLAPACFQKVI
jgi:hypothetical protein